MKWINRFSLFVLFVAVVISTFMVLHHAGAIEGLDFGCGQYYYTDIPGWQRYFTGNHFVSRYPSMLFIILFFVWGFLMVKFWIWVDKRFTNNEIKQ